MLAYYLMGKIILRKDQPFTSSNHCILSQGIYYLSSGLGAQNLEEEELLNSSIFLHSMASG